MTQSMTCKKVTSLLAMYIDNKLDEETAEFVRAHLEICPECFQKYNMLRQLIWELRNAYRELLKESKSQERKYNFSIKEYEKFHANLSAYFDNELPLNESVNMKKYMIKFPNARNELEEMYNLHNLISVSALSVKKNFANDISKKVSNTLRGKPNYTASQKFFRVASYVISVAILSVFVFFMLPVGKAALDKGLQYFKKAIYVNTPFSQGVQTSSNFPE